MKPPFTIKFALSAISAAGILALALLSGCSRGISGYSSLTDKGILSVSSTNPYLGSNLLIAQEAERSSYLLNFLRERGAPKAIRVDVGTLEMPELVLFYPEEKSYFLAHWETRRTPPQWITSGPFGVSRKDYKELARILKDTKGEPIFMLWGRPFRFRAEQETQFAKVPEKKLVPKLPPPKPAPKPVAKAKKPAVANNTSEHPSAKDEGKTVVKSPLDFKPLNSDQQAIQISKGFAPRDKNGDVLHQVKAETETVGKIAKWYTGSTDNVQAIRAASGLSDDASVKVGMKIRVPLSLLKELKAMPADFK